MLIVRHLTTGGTCSAVSLCGRYCRQWATLCTLAWTYVLPGWYPGRGGRPLLVADVVERRSGEQDAEAGSRAAPLASSYAVLPSWP